MSLHYIIDGYNVIKQVSYLSGIKLRDGRDGLIKILQKYRPQGSLKNKVTIVFDGKDDVFFPSNTKLISPTRSNSNIKVIFSKNETADDKIKRMARKAVNPKVLIVVTDDKEIQYFVKSYGVKRQTVKQFLNPISKKTKLATKSKCTPKEKPPLSSQKAIAITKELQEIWNDNN